VKLALLQEKQNGLYNFAATEGAAFSFAEARKLRDEMLGQNFALMAEAVSRGADFLVTSEAINFPGPPELCSFPAWDLVRQGYDEIVEKIAGFAAHHHIWITAGLYRPLPKGIIRNAALVFNRRGETAEVYDKMHLAGSERQHLEAGNRFCIVDTEFGKIGVCICWDMQFPEICRILALGGARLVVCPTWGWESIYANCRAYENGISVAGAMAVPPDGPIQGLRSASSIITPDGLNAAEAGTEAAEVLVCGIDLRQEWPARRDRLEGRRPLLYKALST
jgi:predicted amidohydrolase